eukprot:jgi/Chrzof1/6092/Cz17g09120.t1
MACCRKRPVDKVEKPVYDDEDCQYGIKPSELFSVNEDKDMDSLKALGGVEGLAKALHTNTRDGLDLLDKGSRSVEEHRRVFGPNSFKATAPKNFFMLCLENLQDPIILLLIAAALHVNAQTQCYVQVSTVLGAALPEQRAHNEWIEGVAIWIAVFVVVCVGE